MLTDDAYETLDPMGGQWVNRGLLCKIYPCIDPRDRADAESPLDGYINEDAGEYFHREYAHLSHASLS